MTMDLVLEHNDGPVTGIEVKSAATVHRSDCRRAVDRIGVWV